MRSFEVLSALLVSATVVQALSISGDTVCTTTSGCDGVLLDVASDSSFSLKCADKQSCEGSHIVVHSDCTLNPGGIQCIKQESCMDATILVSDSNLATDANNFLNCLSSKTGACTNLILTLEDSSIALLCGDDDCDNMQVHLFGSSTLELMTDSVITTDSSKALTIYLYDSSQLIDNGITGYNLVTEAPTTSTTTTTTTSTTPKPTVPTSTPAPIITSTSTISTPIISTVQTTTKTNTIASTTLKPTTTPTIPTPTTPTVPITTTTTPTPTIPSISTQTSTIPSSIPATTNTPNTQTTASTPTVPTTTNTNTTSTTPMPTTSTFVTTANATVPNSTPSFTRTSGDVLVTTEEDDSGNGSNKSPVVVYGAVGGGVVLVSLVLTVGCCFFLRSRDRSKKYGAQNDGEKETEMFADPVSDDAEENENIVFISSDNEDDEKQAIYVTPGRPSFVSDIDLDESSSTESV